MSLTRLPMIAALLLCSAPVLAHAHLVRSVPAPDSVLGTAPDDLVLEFGEPVRLTALWLQKTGGPREALGPLPRAAGKELTVPFPRLSAGTYLVMWRVLSADGHVKPGTLTFKVTGISAAPAAQAATPTGAPAPVH